MTELERMAEALGGGSLERLVVSPVRRIAFWIAIVLPFTYLPLLATGIETTQTLLAFLVLVSLNVCALIVGHSHRD